MSFPPIAGHQVVSYLSFRLELASTVIARKRPLLSHSLHPSPPIRYGDSETSLAHVWSYRTPQPLLQECARSQGLIIYCAQVTSRRCCPHLGRAPRPAIIIGGGVSRTLFRTFTVASRYAHSQFIRTYSDPMSFMRG